MPCPFCKVESKNCGCWYRRPLLALMLLVASCFASGCASSPLPKEFLPMASHVLSKSQDIEQHTRKLYNRLCAGKLLDQECIALDMEIESAFGLTLDQLFVDFEAMNELAKAALQ